MAAGSTYTKIATTTVSGSSTNSITFSSISNGYTDLVLICSVQNSAAGSALGMQVGNGSVDTASNYSVTELYGDGSSASSYRLSNITYTLNTVNIAIPTTSAFMPFIINCQNYSNTTTYKTFLTRSGAAGQGVEAIVNLWRSTSAINVITLLLTGAQYFNAGSTFTLYGIAAA